jgi:hypothetical protein
MDPDAPGAVCTMPGAFPEVTGSCNYRELQLTYVDDDGTYTGPASTLVRRG